MASAPAESPPSPESSGTPPPPDASSSNSSGTAPPVSPPPPEANTPPAASPPPPTPASPPPAPPQSTPPPSQTPPTSPPPAPSNNSSSSSPPPAPPASPAPAPPNNNPPSSSSSSSPNPPQDNPSASPPPSPPQEKSSSSSPPPPPPVQTPDTPASQSPPTQTPPEAASTAPSASSTPAAPTSPTFAPPTPGVSNTPGSILSPPSPSSSTNPSGSTPPANKSPNPSSSSRPPPPSGSSDANVGVVIAGIVVVGIVILALIALCIVCTRKKKKKQPYYPDPGRPRQDQFQNPTSQWQSPQDHIVNLTPPPGMMGTPMGGAAAPWAATPSPGANMSGEYSSSPSGQHYGPSVPPLPPSPLGGFSKSQFTYDQLATATSGFSQSNLLGQGGFGFVHKGVLADGIVVAVKSLKSGSGQGEREFQAEVEIISRIHHRHLVSLVGYCISQGQRMLVYEYVANKTLEFHLHGKGQPVMDWSTRLRIALGSAKGLAYLHEDCHPRIIHRDIKAANILLDNNFEAKVADFGLAKLTSDNFTHVSTRVMGTFGYLAPEYASSGKLTEKSDVFSFGVMLLELITGRRPVDTTNRMMEDSLVDWARPLLTKATEDGNYDQLVDPRLEGNYIPHEMARMVSCAAASIRHSSRKRPKMSQIVRSLEGDSALEDTSESANSGQSSGLRTSNYSSAYDTGAYNADMMKFRKMVMSSQEFASSEYGGTSEDYGHGSISLTGENSREMGNSGPPRQNY